MSETLNQKVVHWASGHVGKHVGRRECWDLADEALTKNGGSSSNDLGPDGPDADYVWGDQVSNLQDVIPGDILQYRDYVETTTTTAEVRFADGSGWDESQVAEMSHEHHTSIVSRNPGSGALTVFEQNYLWKPRTRQINAYALEGRHRLGLNKKENKTTGQRQDGMGNGQGRCGHRRHRYDQGLPPQGDCQGWEKLSCLHRCYVTKPFATKLNAPATLTTAQPPPPAS